jgi:hypothetical protein
MNSKGGRKCQCQCQCQWEPDGLCRFPCTKLSVEFARSKSRTSTFEELTLTLTLTLSGHHLQNLVDFRLGVVKVRTETNVMVSLPILSRGADDVRGGQPFE